MNTNFLIKHPEHEKGFRFWKEKLAIIEDFTSFDYYPHQPSTQRNRLTVDLSEQEKNQLKRVSNNNELAAYVVVLTVVHTLLFKYQQKKVHTTIIPDKAGCNIPFILDIDHSDSFRDLLNRAKTELKHVYQNGEFPFKDLFGEEIDEMLGRISNIACTLDHHMNILHRNSRIGYLFTLSFHPEIEINLTYDSSLKEPQVRLITGYFKKVLAAALEKPDLLISEIDLLGEAEKEIVYNMQRLDANYNKQSTIPDLFLNAVEKYPNKNAIIDGDERITYEELNQKSNQLAHYLKEKEVKTDELVGIYMDRSIELMISILGVLKAGAAYVPLDPTHPAERTGLICEESDMRFLIATNNSNLSTAAEIINLASNSVSGQLETDLDVKPQPDDLAYVMFTSGSTGKPKGVMIEHRNVVRLLSNDRFEFDFHANDVWSMFHSHCFDFSVWEVFGALVNGAELVIIPKEMTINHKDLWYYLNKHQVTVFNQTPHSFYQFIKEDRFINKRMNSLRYIIFGGEALSPEKLISFHQKYPEVKLVNMYGITETTVHVTYKPLTMEDMENGYSNIGVPISTLNVFILNEENEPVPPGVVGEICVSGSGLARGYLNNEVLTNEKFVHTNDKYIGKVYKSGDLGRYLLNGELEYIGRKDFQVSVRGYRIELGEIQSQLNRISGVEESIIEVDANEDDEKSIIAYYVADSSISNNRLRKELARMLPTYMVPSIFKAVDSIPLNHNGKVDKHKLKETLKEGNQSGRKAEDDLGNLLITTWQDVLHKETINIDDNFYEIGGDSIKAIQIISQLRNRGYEANVQHLLSYPTIEVFKDYVHKSETIDDVGMREGSYALTPIQHEFFQEFLEGNEPHHYNQAIMIYSKDGFEQTLIEQSFEKIMEHHDNLRTIFKKDDQAIQATIRAFEEGQYDFDVYEFTGIQNVEGKITETSNQLQASLNIYDGPLVRLALFKTDDGDHLLFAIHHLIIDGLSFRILLEDFYFVYDKKLNNQEVLLPRRTASFAEWSNEISRIAQEDVDNPATAYWENMKWPGKNNTGKHVEVGRKGFELEKEKTGLLLNEANSAFNTKPNEILMTALGLAAEAHFGEEDIIIALESHGRDNSLNGIDVSRTIGWFTSIFPFQLVTDQNNIESSIIENKDNLRRITPNSNDYLNQKHLNPERKVNPKYNGRPAISFNYLGQLDREVNTDLFTLSDISFGETSGGSIVSPYELDINCFIIHEQLRVNIGYAQRRFNEETIIAFANVLLEKIELCIDHCLNQESQQQTATDFSYKGLSLEELEGISAQLNN
ncbi:amino acid adenylation domain-containing protein [Oceanobacillus alkalisoli]|uniref:amino acid adenylation domain-containing protein n=1 Tax=Oceanobacillus alkalisoli TaxID=2925113 RepID=UPI001F11D8B1|nr:amino acid adenylation domain-containing protein [Oceanobacillus alkalisoli]MCF3943149.1 amino acid adenylation domain-containing protein [Oceanobacillus alkalisoli]